jgi:peroxiredoxin Q/BCP
VIGEPAPEFSAPASDGRTYTLRELKGRSIVLVFYCANNTPG